MLHGRTAFTGKRRMAGGYSMPFLVHFQNLILILLIVNMDDFVAKYKQLNLGNKRILESV